MSALLQLASIRSCTEKPGAIPPMAIIILAGLLWAGWPVSCDFGGGCG